MRIELVVFYTYITHVENLVQGLAPRVTVEPGIVVRYGFAKSGEELIGYQGAKSVVRAASGIGTEVQGDCTIELRIFVRRLQKIDELGAYKLDGLTLESRTGVLKKA